MSINIDGVEYVRADSLPTVDGEHVLVRSGQAGVFVGRLVSREGDVVELVDARRIWFWSGAASLSELAVLGTSKPGACKFPVALPAITVLGVCEVISMTQAAVESIAAVPVWSEQ